MRACETPLRLNRRLRDKELSLHDIEGGRGFQPSLYRSPAASGTSATEIGAHAAGTNAVPPHCGGDAFGSVALCLCGGNSDRRALRNIDSNAEPDEPFCSWFDKLTTSGQVSNVARSSIGVEGRCVIGSMTGPAIAGRR